MRAVTYQGPRTLRVGQLPRRPLQAGEVRVAVDSVGVCGTDVRIFNGEHSAYSAASGRVPGHEIVGRVIQRSTTAVPSFVPAEGERVFVAPNFGCGMCRQCRNGDENLCVQTQGIGITLDGGFAEEVVVPASAVEAGNLIRLTPTTDPDMAVLIEPLACVVRGQDKVALTAGDRVLVAGGGPIGLLHIALAVARGASQVICSEPSPTRRAAARRAGATSTVDPTDRDLAAVVADVTADEGMDVVITAAPVHQLQAEALRLAGARGRVLFFAGLPKSRPTVELDTNLAHYKELLIAGTTASALDDCLRATALLTDGSLDVSWMVSDTRTLGQTADAIAMVQDTSVIKVVIRPQDQEAPA